MRDQKSACPRLGKGISLNGQPHMKIGGMFNNGESQSSHLCGDHRRVLALDTHLQVAKRDGGNLAIFRNVCGKRDHIILPYRSLKLCHLVLLIVYWEATNLFRKVIRNGEEVSRALLCLHYTQRESHYINCSIAEKHCLYTGINTYLHFLNAFQYRLLSPLRFMTAYVTPGLSGARLPLTRTSGLLYDELVRHDRLASSQK